MVQSESAVNSSVLPANALEQAGDLAADILEDIELSRADLNVVVLKALRLARLLNDFESEQILIWESIGYPTHNSNEAFAAGRKAGRAYFIKTTGPIKGSTEVIYEESVESLTLELESERLILDNAERLSTKSNAIIAMKLAGERLAQRRAFIYDYVSRKHYEIKFSNIVGGIFERLRSSVDASIGEIVPDAVRKLSSVSDNLNSDNPEDWANAAHSCRRLIQELADALFPAQTENRVRKSNGKTKDIELGQKNYKNRLMAYIEDSSDSDSFNNIVGSQLDYIGQRLDAIYEAAQKGTHSEVSKQEAERCVVHTYLLVGDILSLRVGSPKRPSESLTDD